MKISSLHDLHDEDILRELISGGETSTLEFKRKLPSIEITAKLLSSFANTEGGIIIIGIDDNCAILGLDDAGEFNDYAQKAFIKTNPGITGYSSGIVHLDDKPLGCILVWPQKGLPVSVNKKFYRRIGSTDVSFDSSEINKVIHEREDLTDLFISTSELHHFITTATEDQFIDVLLVPIMRKMGFVGVSPKGHSDKSLEFGQDIRCFKFQLPTGHWLYFAAQVKAGKISYSPVNPTINIEQILTQVRMAQKKEMFDFETNSYHKPDHVILIASGKIVEGARTYLCEQLLKTEGPRILFWDSNLIQERLKKQGSPKEYNTKSGTFSNHNCWELHNKFINLKVTFKRLTLLEDLIISDESPLLDFKKEFYKLPINKAELAKDISAMANSTKRAGSDGYILIGKYSNNLYDIEHDSIPDEASVQQMVNSLVDPPIKFTVERKSHSNNGKNIRLVLITIPYSARKPHLISKDCTDSRKKIYKGQCFIRRGTSTSIANRVEIAEIVHDADKTVNPYKVLIRYIDSVQKTGEKININEFEKLLYHDLIPFFFAPLTHNLDSVQKNSDGVTVHIKSISKDIQDKQEKLLQEVIAHTENEEYDLARYFIEKIPEIKECFACCIVGGYVYSKLDQKEKTFDLFERAQELDPLSPIVNYRIADAHVQFKNDGDASIYYERAIQFSTLNSDDILKYALFNLAILYEKNKVTGRAKELMADFLKIHPGNDEYSVIAKSILKNENI